MTGGQAFCLRSAWRGGQAGLPWRAGRGGVCRSGRRCRGRAVADDSDLEKTEPASPRRLEQAREEGQVARSRELSTFLILAGGMAGLWLSAMLLYEKIGGMLHRSLGFSRTVAMDETQMLAQNAASAGEVLLGLMPLFAVLLVAALAGSVLLGGLLLSSKSLAPKMERLNALKGMKRMFSAQTLIELIKALAKSLLIGGVAAWAIWTRRDTILALLNVPVAAALAEALGMVARVCVTIIAALLFIVLLDVPWQIFSHLKKLRMSRQDMKQEHKESEGDPHVKGRLRQLQRSMARRRMMANVPQADVVVTNPTHYAVALRYEEGKGGAPRVVAKGSGLVAARIRALAAEHGVPLLQAPPLARALHHHVELEQEIPIELYAAVAEVLAWVFRLRAWKASGMGVEPVAPEGLAIPEGFDVRSGKRGVA
ncbi:Flagellar biosynthetic protein FlhB [Kerstersia similis]